MLLRTKALFMIYLIIFVTITISPISAQSSNNLCCEKGKNGESCQYLSAEKCDTTVRASNSPAVCEETSYCAVGCCVTQDGCSKSVPQATCLAKGGKWDPDSTCELLSQCEKNCCMIADQCLYVTESKCGKEFSLYPDAEMIFEPAETETQCLELCQQENEGCCVQEDGLCSWTTRSRCDVAGEERTTNPNTGFFKNTLCSSEELACECTPQDHLDCYGDDVYWFDSCGNVETIYEDCEYSTGTLCAKEDDNVYCKDLNCKNTWDNPANPSDGIGRKNGESWCEYDGAVGGIDLVGSRFSRHICINGEEIAEHCKDFREEFCVQGTATGTPSGDIEEARCRENRWEDCAALCNSAADATSEKEYQKLVKEDKECCENVDLRDCIWAGEEDEDGKLSGVCFPMVSPGFRHWEGSSESTSDSTSEDETSESSSGTQGDGASTCQVADKSCEVVFLREESAKDWEVWEYGQTEWSVAGNKACIEDGGKDFKNSFNSYCVAMGDCGAHYNYVGSLTYDGYSCSVDGGVCAGEKRDQKYDFEEPDVGSFSEFRSGEGFHFGDIDTSPDADTEKWLDQWALWVIGIDAALNFLLPITTPTAMGFLKLGITSLGKDGVKGFNMVSKVSSWGTKSMEVGKTISKGTYSGDLTAGADTQMGFQAGETYNIGGESTTFDGTSFFDPAVDPSGSLGESAIPEGFTQTDSGLWNIPEGTTIQGNGINIEAGSATAGNGVTKTSGFMEGLGTALKVAGIVLAVVEIILAIHSIIKVLSSDTDDMTIELQCKTWQAPTGGENCNLCKSEWAECSEYRCRSLGQTCRLINEGTTEAECIDMNPNDANSPAINPDETVLTQGYTLTRTSSGFKINEPIGIFQPIRFGITTDEPAICNYAYNHSQDFEEMSLNFGSTYYTYNKNTTLTDLNFGEEYQINVRCQDASGNKNMNDYIINFITSSAPDLTPPIIEYTSIANNAYLPSTAQQTELQLYTNEKVKCKGSRSDQTYDEMQVSLVCSFSRGTNNLYSCNAILTNLTYGENNFYFRCRDYSNNTNQESYNLNLIGTKALNITSVAPTGKLYQNSPALQVITSEGSSLGKATCYYSDKYTYKPDMTEFFQTNSTIHLQQLSNLTKAIYSYNILCEDIAGNEATNTIIFQVDVDTTPPELASLYTSLSGLYITTNEITSCQYSNANFEYGQGTDMTNPLTLEHSAPTQTYYYINCIDQYNNKMPKAILIRP